MAPSHLELQEINLAIVALSKAKQSETEQDFLNNINKAFNTARLIYRSRTA